MKYQYFVTKHIRNIVYQGNQKPDTWFQTGFFAFCFWLSLSRVLFHSRHNVLTRVFGETPKLAAPVNHKLPPAHVSLPPAQRVNTEEGGSVLHFPPWIERGRLLLDMHVARLRKGF